MIKKNLSVVLGAFAGIIIWLTVLLKGYSFIVGGINPFTGSPLFTPLGVFIMACLVAPLWEEAVFRHAALRIGKSFKERGMDMLIPISIISSAIFGWGHGSGPISITIQGIVGMLLCYVYVKTNYNYWCAVITHFLWNFSLMYMFPVLTGQYGIKVW